VSGPRRAALTGDNTIREAARSRPWLRAGALAAAGAGTLFWLYTFHAIAQVPVGDGTGFQWLAVMPLGMVFLVFTLPSLILALSGRMLEIALPLGCVGLVAFALLWAELLREFYS
jgi:hypothetical protein